MDCQPKAYHSAHDGVGNQVFSLEQALLAEYLLQCFKWHRGVFPWAFMTHGTVYYISSRRIGSTVFNTVKLAFILGFKVISAISPSPVTSIVFELWKLASVVTSGGSA